MKRILSTFLMLALCFTFFACESIGDGMTDHTPGISESIANTEDTTGNPSAESIPDTESTKSTESTESTDTTEQAETVHAHIWKNATCSAPKTCSACGATEGKANGHNWQAPTCSEPKKCTVCGTTNGLTAGHNFSDGKCTMCGKDDPDYMQVTMVWIPTKGGTKYHASKSCSGMNNPDYVTKSQAEASGFTPCKRCYG